MGEGYKHLSLDERIEIEKGLEAGLGAAQIARLVGRDRSTVHREIRRGLWRPGNTSAAYLPYRPKRLRTAPWTGLVYLAGQAQVKASERAARSHRPYRMRSDALVSHVVDRLGAGWSPQMIAGRLGRERAAGLTTLKVCPETLYAWIYHPAQAWRNLPGYLPRGQVKRRKRRGRKVHSSKIDRRVSIHHRPAGCDERTEFGHWEADTVIGARPGPSIHTEVERMTRFYIAVKVPRVTSAEAIATQKRLFKAMPPAAARSVTMDNGTEFHRHFELTDELGIDTFFADPYSAWQRGTNEHHNGRLRAYLPKGTRFDDLENQELTAIINEINNQPRKILNWATPAEAFTQQLALAQTTTRCTSN